MDELGCGYVVLQLIRAQCTLSSGLELPIFIFMQVGLLTYQQFWSNG